MRSIAVCALLLLCRYAAQAQTVPDGWKPIRDAKGACQIAVPAEWTPLGDNSGAAILHDPGTAIAVVTSQAGQDFKPLTPGMLKNFGVPKEKIFENSAARLFYQDKASANPEDPSAFSAKVPAKDGTCSCHIVVLPSIGMDIAKKIALSIAPAAEKN